MSKIQAIQEVIRGVFKDSSIQINDNTTANDIDGWDSLTHLQIITELEKHFSIKFTLSELIGLDTVGDIDREIQKKIA